jgi:hypothetical protein
MTSARTITVRQQWRRRARQRPKQPSEAAPASLAGWWRAEPARHSGLPSTSRVVNRSTASCWTLLCCAAAIPSRPRASSSGISIIRFAILLGSLSYCASYRSRANHVTAVRATNSRPSRRLRGADSHAGRACLPPGLFYRFNLSRPESRLAGMTAGPTSFKKIGGTAARSEGSRCRY